MNPINATNWIPGLSVTGAGVLIALVFMLVSRRLKRLTPAPTSIDDLNVRYAAKLAQLKDHVGQKHLFALADWEAMNQQLQLEAASILKERDTSSRDQIKAEARAAQKAAAQAVDDSFWARRPALKGGLVGGLIVGFLGLLAFNLYRFADTAQQQPSMPARAGGPGQPTPPDQDPKFDILAKNFRAAPEDPEAVGAITIYLVRMHAYDEVRSLAARLALFDPFNVKGRIARSVLSAIDGDYDTALPELEHLAKWYPEAYDAHLFAGLIAHEKKEFPRAFASLDAYLAQAPSDEQPPMMRMMIQQMKDEALAPPLP